MLQICTISAQDYCVLALKKVTFVINPRCACVHLVCVCTCLSVCVCVCVCVCVSVCYHSSPNITRFYALNKVHPRLFSLFKPWIFNKSFRSEVMA